MIGAFTTILFDEAKRIWCYRWLALATGVAVFLLSVAYVMHMPDVYDAWGQVFVSKQTPLTAAAEGVSLVGESYGGSYVVQKTMLNDDSLEAVIKQRDPRAAGMDRIALARAVGQLRSQIHVLPDQGDGFVEFHYADTSPARARQTVQLLLDHFISLNVNRSRTDLDRAEKFLDQQIASYGGMLSASQANIADFRSRHPEVAAQPLLLNPAGEYVEPPAQPAPGAPAAAQPAARRTAPSAERVAALQAKLATLLTTYTDQYPDVVSTRRQLADAMADRDREEAALPPAPAPAGATAAASAPRPVARPRFIAPPPLPVVAPAIAAQWVDLQRKDEVLRLGYQQLIGKREATRMSQAIYDSNDTGKYQVTRTPTTPTAPIGPKRPLFIAIAAVLSAACGLGAAYVLGGMRGILVAPRELENAFQLPVVGTVSLERAWQTRPDSDRGHRRQLTFNSSAT